MMVEWEVQVHGCINNWANGTGMAQWFELRAVPPFSFDSCDAVGSNG